MRVMGIYLCTTTDKHVIKKEEGERNESKQVVTDKHV